MIRSSRKGERFVGCTNFPNCRNAYPLPQKGVIVKTDKVCDACKAPIILLKGKKPVEICINSRCPKLGGNNVSPSLIGKCPKCGNDLIIRTSRAGNQFVGCTNFPRCKNTYSLPKNGDVVTTDKVCNECKTPIIKVKNEGKPLEDICLNPDCPTKKK